MKSVDHTIGTYSITQDLLLQCEGVLSCSMAQTQNHLEGGFKLL